MQAAFEYRRILTFPFFWGKVTGKGKLGWNNPKLCGILADWERFWWLLLSAALTQQDWWLPHESQLVISYLVGVSLTKIHQAFHRVTFKQDPRKVSTLSSLVGFRIGGQPECCRPGWPGGRWVGSQQWLRDPKWQQCRFCCLAKLQSFQMLINMKLNRVAHPVGK